MSITGLAIKRPSLFIVFFLVLGLLGILSYTKLKYELLPTLATPTITIITAYPGASPIDVETSVTKKMEDALAVVSNSKKVYSSSSANLSVVSIEFTDNTNPDVAIQDVQRALNNVISQFPSGVKTPVLEKFNVNDLPVLKLACVSNLPLDQLYKIIKDNIKPQIAQLQGVGKITLMGNGDVEWKIFINQSQLVSHGITISDVSTAIQNANVSLPIGSIKDKDKQIELNLDGQLKDADMIKNIQVKSYSDGSALYLKDVANVQKGQTEEEIASRFDQQTAVAILISKQSGGNAVQVAQEVREKLTELESQYSDIHLKFNIASDSSEFTLQSSHQVFEDLGIAILLVALVMLLFLHSLRNALIIMVSIPVSLFTTIIIMYLLGYTLNLMTLLAISLVIGVLVDDSIVVLENIYHHLEMGEDKRAAALNGREEIGFSALSITMVDVVVFLPMALVPGLVGSLIKEFSLVIVTSTLSSLMVSFTLTPMIASRFAKLEILNPKKIFGKISQVFEKIIAEIISYYKWVLRWALNHKIIVGLAAFIILLSALMLVFNGTVGTEFLPQADKGELAMFVKLEPGIKLSETKDKVLKIENKLKKLPTVASLFSNIGYQNDGISERTQPNLATINIQLVELSKRKDSTLAAISRELRNEAMTIDGVDARVTPIGLFGANASPIQLVITNANREIVLDNANTILQAISTIPGIVNPRLSVDRGNPDFSIHLDRTNLQHYGLMPTTIAAILHQDVYGDDDIKLNINGSEEKLRVQLAPNERTNGNQLMNIAIPAQPNQAFTLSQLATVKMTSTAATLERRDKQPSITILADVSGRPVGDVGTDIHASIAKINIPAQTRIRYEGDLEQQGDSFSNLGFALLISLVLIYLIMVVLYNDWSDPFVILFSIPLAISGALLALALTAKSINIFSIFGLIMMMGLVAKNGILLVDKANHILLDKIKTKESIISALIEAGSTRFRPIFMTTIAMVIGMIPLALGKSASSAFSSGLAWVLIGGLSSSMLLTLVVVPVVYYLINRVKEKRNQGVNNSSKTWMPATILAIGLWGFFPNSQAQTITSLSVSQAVDLGLKQNEKIKFGLLEIEKYGAGFKEALSYRYPQVNMDMSYYRNVKPSVFFLPTFGINSQQQITYDVSNYQAIPASSANAYMGNVNLQIPIFNTTISGNIKSAAINQELSRSQLKMKQWDLADLIRKTYYNALMLDANLNLSQANLNRATQNLNDCRSLEKKGNALASDTLNAWSNCELMKINVEKATLLQKQNMNNLKQLLGLDDDTLYLTDSLFDIKFDHDNFNADTLEDFYRHRPDFELNAIKKKAALQNIENSKSLGRPSLSFVSQYTIQSQSDNFNFSKYKFPNSFFVGLQLTVPLFNGFHTQSNVMKNKIELKQNDLERTDMEKQARVQMKNELLEMQNAQNEITHCNNIVTSKKEILELIKQRWMKGFAKYNDVADAELEIIKAQNTWLQSKYEWINAVNSLKKDAGYIY